MLKKTQIKEYSDTNGSSFWVWGGWHHRLLSLFVSQQKLYIDSISSKYKHWINAYKQILKGCNNSITLFGSITMLCGDDDILQNIF